MALSIARAALHVYAPAMATYAIGDLQGHLDPLDRLLHRVGFDPRTDRIIVAGDLVNRGPDSVGVLRRLVSLGTAADAVLGNHDLHALCRFAGVAPTAEPDETLASLLAAPDRDALFHWLAHRPLLIEADGCLIVHAGLPPGWSPDVLRRRAADVHALLTGPRAPELLARCTKRRHGPFPPDATLDPAAETLGLLTRLRLVDGAGAPVRGAGPLESAPTGAMPWFHHPARARGWRRIIFGHWATLGLWVEGDMAAIDTGYVWGGLLTAFRLDDGAIFSVAPDRPSTAR